MDDIAKRKKYLEAYVDQREEIHRLNERLGTLIDMNEKLVKKLQQQEKRYGYIYRDFEEKRARLVRIIKLLERRGCNVLQDVHR